MGSDSRVAARVTRTIIAHLARAIVLAGNIKLAQPSSVSTLKGTPSTVTVAPRPLAGSQPSCTANSMISIMPTQKFGSENPSTELVMMARDPTAVGRSDEHTSELQSLMRISYAVFSL